VVGLLGVRFWFLGVVLCGVLYIGGPTQNKIHVPHPPIPVPTFFYYPDLNLGAVCCLVDQVQGLLDLYPLFLSYAIVV